MSYYKIRLLQASAEEAYNEGKLSRRQYIKILNDIENELHIVDNGELSKELQSMVANHAKS